MHKHPARLGTGPSQQRGEFARGLTASLAPSLMTAPTLPCLLTFPCVLHATCGLRPLYLLVNDMLLFGRQYSTF
jgi:hypothetical protein